MRHTVSANTPGRSAVLSCRSPDSRSSKQAPEDRRDWKLSVLGLQVRICNRAWPKIDTIELKAVDVTRHRASPVSNAADITPYFEIPITEDPPL